MPVPARPPWWESRGFALAAMLLAAVPLLIPAVPPLTDVPGHIGRYYIAAHLAGSPLLARHWQFEWGLIGNLGVDLIVEALAPLIPAPLAAKLVIVAIPPLWVWGLIRLSRASGTGADAGRLAPGAALGFPLVYSWPFQFGFVNFMLSATLALHALASWIAMGRAGRVRQRALLFVPVSWVLWIAHSFGWGLFGLIAFAAELAERRRTGADWRHALAAATLWAALLGSPVVAMLAAAPHGGGLGAEWTATAKLVWFLSLLRERWQGYDVIAAFLIYAAAWTGWRSGRLRYDAAAGAAMLIGLAAFLMLPRLLLGGAYVDMRMLPVALAIGFAGLRARRPLPGAAPGEAPGEAPGSARSAAAMLALFAAGFFVVRTLTTTAALLLYAQTQSQALAAVDRLPRGAAVLVLVREGCTDWRSDRLSHVAGMAIVRREIFENGQWTLPGQQLLRTPHRGVLTADPSQILYPADCPDHQFDLNGAAAAFDRGLYTRVWTMGFPPHARLAPDVVLEWQNGVSALYRVIPARAGAVRPDAAAARPR